MAHEKILIVKDDRNLSCMMQDILLEEKYQIRIAETGKDALEIVRTNPPDLIMSDMDMPSMKGLELLREVKKIAPKIQFIVMTDAGKLKANDIVCDYITKPINIEMLKIVVERIFGK